MIKLLATCIAKSFEINMSKIKLNDPFRRGYITKTYGNSPIPWIQIEMSRELYLSKPWFDENFLSVGSAYLKKLNNKFENTLNLFMSKIS